MVANPVDPEMIAMGPMRDTTTAAYEGSGLTDEQIQWIIGDIWHHWYRADWAYAWTTVAFFVAAIGLFALFRVNAFIYPHPFELPKRITASLRGFTSRQTRVATWYAPTWGRVLALAIMTLVFTLLTLVPRPYYWPSEDYGHSPPIATRTGWLSMAMLPFVFALAAKANLVTAFTGISHERLQLFHQWAGWISFVLALIHTFPFIITRIEWGIIEEGWATDPFLWTGVLALVPQGWLVFMSLPWLRNRFYEFFKAMHMVVAVLFLLGMFFHVANTLTSWHYIYAIVAISLSTTLFRLGRLLYRSHGLRGAPSTVTTVDGTWLTLSIPTTATWRAGQHFFVRVLGTGIAHSLTAHPLTVVNLPSPDEHSVSTAQFLVRVRSGLTARLALKASSTALRAMLDGPYGGLDLDLSTFDRVILCAGGSGVAFILGALASLESSKRPIVDLVWSTRHLVSSGGVMERLEAARQTLGKQRLMISCHVTGSTSTETMSDLDEKRDDIETTKGGNDSVVPTEATRAGRPDLRAIIGQVFATHTGTLAVVACGPESFNYDVCNAVSSGQYDIARGRSQVQDAQLHTEVFGW